MKTIGEKLQKLLEEKEINRTELANASGTTRATIITDVKSDTIPMNRLLKYSKAFNIRFKLIWDDFVLTYSPVSKKIETFTDSTYDPLKVKFEFNIDTYKKLLDIKEQEMEILKTQLETALGKLKEYELDD